MLAPLITGLWVTALCWNRADARGFYIRLLGKLAFAARDIHACTLRTAYAESRDL